MNSYAFIFYMKRNESECVLRNESDRDSKLRNHSRSCYVTLCEVFKELRSIFVKLLFLDLRARIPEVKGIRARRSRNRR